MDEKKPVYRKYPLLTLGLFLFFFIAIVLFISDWAIGYISAINGTKVTWTYDKVLSQRSIRLREYTPNTNTTYFSHDATNPFFETYSFYGKASSVVTDEHGFLIAQHFKNHEDPDLQIAFLGGSTTECLIVDEEKRFPLVVGNRLSNDTTKVNVYNGGVSGGHSMHSLDVLINKVVPLRPDICVMMHNINDLNILLRQYGYFGPEKYRSLIKYPGSDDLKYQWLHDYLPNLLAVTKGALKSLRNQTSSSEAIPLTQEESDKVIGDFRSSVNSFVSICQSWNIRPILMTQHNRFGDGDKETLMIPPTSIGDDNYRVLYDRFNEVIRSVAAEKNVVLIDLEKGVPQNKTMMYDIVHTTNEGSVFVGNLIADEIRELLFDDVEEVAEE